MPPKDAPRSRHYSASSTAHSEAAKAAAETQTTASVRRAGDDLSHSRFCPLT